MAGLTCENCSWIQCTNDDRGGRSLTVKNGEERFVMTPIDECCIRKENSTNYKSEIVMLMKFNMPVLASELAIQNGDKPNGIIFQPGAIGRQNGKT